MGLNLKWTRYYVQPIIADHRLKIQRPSLRPRSIKRTFPTETLDQKSLLSDLSRHCLLSPSRPRPLPHPLPSPQRSLSPPNPLASTPCSSTQPARCGRAPSIDPGGGGPTNPRRTRLRRSRHGYGEGGMDPAVCSPRHVRYDERGRSQEEAAAASMSPGVGSGRGRTTLHCMRYFIPWPLLHPSGKTRSHRYMYSHAPAYFL